MQKVQKVQPVKPVKQENGKKNTFQTSKDMKNETNQSTTSSQSTYQESTLPPAGNAGGLFLSSVGFLMLVIVITKVIQKPIKVAQHGR